MEREREQGRAHAHRLRRSTVTSLSRHFDPTTTSHIRVHAATACVSVYVVFVYMQTDTLDDASAAAVVAAEPGRGLAK